MTSKTELSHTEFLQVADINGIHYGSDQDWYAAERQRQTGCGPSAAANIFFYNRRKKDISCCGWDKADLLDQMEDAWQYITPRRHGIISTSVFIKKVENYARAHHEKLRYFSLDIPEDTAKRPSLSQVVRFLENGLSSDTPIAFLNLDNGQEETLQRWHWVTITALEYDRGANSAWATISDEGLRKRIDLSLWLETTALGGGFIYFMNAIPESER